MYIFRESCQQVQIVLRQKVSIKRLHLSPSTKENNQKNEITSQKSNKKSKKQLSFPNTTILKEVSAITIDIAQKVAAEPKRCISVQHILPQTPAAPVLQNTEDLKYISVYNKCYDNYITTPLSDNEQQTFERAAGTKQPLAVAAMVVNSQTTQMACKRIILADMEDSCKNLCKRKGRGAVLLDGEYKGISEFDLGKLWQEIVKNHPFLIDIFNTVAGTTTDIGETSEDLKLKYCFLYSVLMNCRWHELSLIQRLNTFLIIEGGCSKQVQNNKNFTAWK